MNRALHIALAMMLSVALAGDATAQWNVSRLGASPNRVYTAFGLDPAFVTSVGYGRLIRLFDRPILLTGDLGVAAADMDSRDFRARLGALATIAHWRSLHLTGSARFITRGTDNSIYRGLNFGADLTGSVGVYRSGWFAAGEFGFDKAVITHITHSDWYRAYFYPEARDGWYLNTGGTFRYGLIGGFNVGRVELCGRFGWQRTESFNVLVPPMYASLGVGLGF